METFRKDACKALLKAAESGNVKAVEMLTAVGVNVVDYGEIRRIALHLAAKAGHSQIVDNLLTSGLLAKCSTRLIPESQRKLRSRKGFSYQMMTSSKKRKRCLDIVQTFSHHETIASVDSATQANAFPSYLKRKGKEL
ncbi:hypothetical protein F4678DRAFT_272460 [Xylaria arbuscula]|nr:hypothetical protein F4678DRAFT_272460 [Xylaria arbuscula]